MGAFTLSSLGLAGLAKGKKLTGFAPDARITNSPINKISYRRTRRLRFLFAALRTRSLSAREELARIATNDQLGFTELLSSMQTQLSGGDAKIDINPRRKKAFVDLAWLLANQPTDPHPSKQPKGHQIDAQKALIMYRWAIEHLGVGRFHQMHLIDALMLSIRLGDEQLSSTVKPRIRAWLFWIPKLVPKRFKTKRALGIAEILNLGFVFGRDFSLNSKLLLIDSRNPFRAQADPLKKLNEAKSWLDDLSRHLLPRDADPLQFEEAFETPFDSLSTKTVKPVTGKRLVTVIVSCYEPNQSILSSVRSILNSSYQNLEVLVIDDASPKSYAGILAQVEDLDLRVRVVRQKQNGGTYRIRNRALGEARGELVTFHDSDDWMHPQRIAWQEKAIRGKKVANVSMSTRVTEMLECVESGRRLRIGICEPSLMFVRKTVVSKIGFFDHVRKGADSEYRKRIEKSFGQDLEIIAPFRVLTLQRADHGGLTDGDLGFRWIVDYRLRYKDLYLNWHRKSEALHLPAQNPRKFYAPRQMRFRSDLANKHREKDLVIGANLCDQKNVDYISEVINEALAADKTVAFWNIPTMYPLALTRTLRPRIMELLNSGKAQLVYPEDNLDVGKLWLAAPSAYLVSRANVEFKWNIAEFDFVNIQSEAETWNVSGEKLEQFLHTELLGLMGD